MAEKNNNYWAERFEKLESDSYQQGIDYTKRLENEYRKAIDNCEKNIAKWYQRLADNNSISMADARKLLSKEELSEFKWSVEEYIKYGKENAINAKWIKELENASAKVHITKYEQIKLELENEANILHDHFDRGTSELLNNIYKNNYKETATMLGHTSKGLDTNRVVKAIQTPWAVDGKNFSERIWGSKEKLVNTLDRVLTQNIIRGESYTKAVKAIKDELQVSYSEAKRLVVTETAAIQTAARFDCMKDLDCEYYEISVAEDEKVCSVCGSFADLGPQSMKDFLIGITAPPFHPNCRCAAMPWYEDELLENEESDNINSENNNYKPSNIEYKNDENIDKSDESGIIKISGGRITNPDSDEAEAFAKKYYKEVRSFSTDYKMIAENLGKTEKEIKIIKDYLFFNEDFEPDCAIAHSWQRLMLGKGIQKHDVTLIEHELLEMKIKKENPYISHIEAHEIASEKYNYPKEAKEHYDRIKKHKKK